VTSRCRADPGPPWREASGAVAIRTDDDTVDVIDVDGNPVRVTGRGMVSDDTSPVPGRGKVSWWPGHGRLTSGGGIPTKARPGRTAGAGVESPARALTSLLCAIGSGVVPSGEGIYE